MNTLAATIDSFAAAALLRLEAQLADPWQVLALVAALVAGVLIVISAFVRTMIPLRWLAVASNIGFVVYGFLQPAPLVAVLHAVLLPVNLWRVGQMVQLTRRVNASVADAQQLEVWLRPYMRVRRYRDGQAVFEAGDVADRLYFVAAGAVELAEIGRRLGPGEMFGEIAFFAPDRRRTSSARCVGPCQLMSIDEDTFRQLVYQNPDFGLEVVRLIAARLTADVRRAGHAGEAAAPPGPGGG